MVVFGTSYFCRLMRSAQYWGFVFVCVVLEPTAAGNCPGQSKGGYKLLHPTKSLEVSILFGITHIDCVAF